MNIERLVEIGELTDDSSGFGPHSFRLGERVVVRRNSTERTVGGDLHDIANGQAGIVVSSGERASAILTLDFTGRLVSLIWVRLDPHLLKHWNVM